MDIMRFFYWHLRKVYVHLDHLGLSIPSLVERIVLHIDAVVLDFEWSEDPLRVLNFQGSLMLQVVGLRVALLIEIIAPNFDAALEYLLAPLDVLLDVLGVVVENLDPFDLLTFECGLIVQSTHFR